MPLDPERLAADVVTIVKGALAPMQTRVKDLETKVAAIPAPVVEDEPDALAASFTGLLQNELTALELAAPTQKRVVRDAQGQIARVVEEPVAEP